MCCLFLIYTLFKNIYLNNNMVFLSYNLIRLFYLLGTKIKQNSTLIGSVTVKKPNI